MSVHASLEQRAIDLQAEGADPMRIELLQRARRFKRSWVDMAEGLLQLKRSRAYEAWGYKDLSSYCAKELLIKKRTVEKLTGSYRALQQHAPGLLQSESGEERGPSVQSLPTLDTVDYFARATAENDANEVVEQLHKAVFEEQRPLRALRRQFDEVLYPKSAEETVLANVRKAQRTAERLSELLPQIEGLNVGRVDAAALAISALLNDLNQLSSAVREQVEQADQSAA